ncbi:transcriptional repressor LexA [Lactobacillus sp. Sy-1]|uniref:transcriptional repressor LexA n=1 Tax=Lactobacillus sp. Sy-1 TaxID=2109645 RepID=UPI001C5AC59E|nr:transcriptional repressor LexA [Lactobacillus sp. Sy-1]
MTKVESRQTAILRFIWNNIKEQGYPPTVREICEGVKLSSTSTVYGHITRLQKKGLLKKNPSKTRALEITPLGLQELDVNPRGNEMPLLGQVAAGEPILAVENATSYFPIPPEFESISDSLFMLTIKGTSMINVGILNHDQVIVKKQSTAENGEIVIAMNEDNEATCKRFYKEDGHYRLQPENDSMRPIILDQVTILGKVISLYRPTIK